MEGWPECSQSSTKLSSRLNQGNHSKVCVLLMALSLTSVLSISCNSNAVFPSWKQNFPKSVDHWLTPWITTLLVKLMDTHLLKKLCDKFMKLKGLLLYSQELVTGSYPVRWIQVTSSHPISLRSVSIIFCLWRSSKLSVPSRLSNKKFVWIFHLSSTCYMPPIVL
jgi:hypothetical protein